MGLWVIRDGWKFKVASIKANWSTDLVQAARLAEGATPAKRARVVKRWLKRRAKRG